MAGQHRISAFLEQLERELWSWPATTRRRILDEVREHLLESAESLVQAGLAEERAIDLTLQRFGSVQELIETFEQLEPEASKATSPIGLAGDPPFREDEMLRKTLLLSASLTAVAAALVAVHSALFDDGSGTLNALKVSACLLVILVGALTWRHAVGRGRGGESVLLAGGILLVAAGSSGAVWTCHLASLTGDWEFWALAVNLLVAAQGALTVWQLWKQGSLA